MLPDPRFSPTQLVEPDNRSHILLQGLRVIGVWKVVWSEEVTEFHQIPPCLRSVGAGYAAALNSSSGAFAERRRAVESLSLGAGQR